MFPLRDTTPARRAPLLTYFLIALNGVIFLYQLTLSPEAAQGFAYHFGIVPARFTQPEWADAVGLSFSLWPFLTTQFLHASLLHLVGNMWMLWVFGDNVEDRMGRPLFLLFYLLVGVLAGLTHLVTNLSSTVPAIGASGAIAGILAAYLALYPRARVLTLIPIFFYPLFVELPAMLFIGIWFVGQLLSGTVALFQSAGAGIAWWAHIGGFIAGISLYRLFIRRPPATPPPKVTYPWGRRGPAVIEQRPEEEDRGGLRF